MMDQFLASVERRAYRMAEIATGNRDDALDIVQEAMFALVRKYSDRDQQEWGPLFHRILQSKINDWYRRRTLKRKLTGWLHSGKNIYGNVDGNSANDGEQSDCLQQVADEQGKGPLEQWQQGKTTELISAGLKALPLRQQQAFLLRVWEGLSVAETAQAMNCSEGSVKTHYSRALLRLRDILEAPGP